MYFAEYNNFSYISFIIKKYKLAVWTCCVGTCERNYQVIPTGNRCKEFFRVAVLLNATLYLNIF